MTELTWESRTLNPKTKNQLCSKDQEILRLMMNVVFFGSLSQAFGHQLITYCQERIQRPC